MKRLILLLALSVLAITGYWTGSAEAYYASPSCDSSKVLSKLKSRFNQTEKIYWHRGHRISRIEGVHLHSAGSNYDSPFDRQYCHATAVFEDGKTRKMHFLIENGAGFAGFGWNVEYCVHGLDPWKYYDGYCRVLSH